MHLQKNPNKMQCALRWNYYQANAETVLQLHKHKDIYTQPNNFCKPNKELGEKTERHLAILLHIW